MTRCGPPVAGLAARSQECQGGCPRGRVEGRRRDRPSSARTAYRRQTRRQPRRLPSAGLRRQQSRMPSKTPPLFTAYRTLNNPCAACAFGPERTAEPIATIDTSPSARRMEAEGRAPRTQGRHTATSGSSRGRHMGFSSMPRQPVDAVTTFRVPPGRFATISAQRVRRVLLGQ
jgi:hypothetical protein